jgi:hypothetical protein
MIDATIHAWEIERVFNEHNLIEIDVQYVRTAEGDAGACDDACLDDGVLLAGEWPDAGDAGLV